MMKRELKRILVTILLGLAILVGLGIGFGGSPKQALVGPKVVMRVLDPSLEQYANMWQDEVSRRFNHATVVLVHGGDFVEGQWVVGDWTYRNGIHVRPVTEVVKEAQAADPTRTVVLLACNPGHLQLGIPGVYYAHSSVWCVPDRNVLDSGFNLAHAKEVLWFGSKPKPVKPVLADPMPSRWAAEPDIVGNVFEFQAD